jgi:hypothetical protein
MQRNLTPNRAVRISTTKYTTRDASHCNMGPALTKQQNGARDQKVLQTSLLTYSNLIPNRCFFFVANTMCFRDVI